MAYQFSSPNRNLKSTTVPVGAAVSTAKKSSQATITKSLWTIVIVVLVVAAGLYLFGGGFGNNSFFGSSVVFKTDWQAVFLDNGQVYFGKVIKTTDKSVALKDIYYLQVMDQSLQGSQGTETPSAQAAAKQRLTLIKLGNEIHGPTDEMLINRDHVVLIEDLKTDSRVVQAIAEYLKNPPTQQPPQPVTPAATQ